MSRASTRPPPSAYTPTQAERLPLNRPTSISSETFKPNFPRDPFLGQLPPWELDIDAVINLSMNIPSKRAFLVLGQPEAPELSALLRSPHLSTALLIFASHSPPLLPSLAGASVTTRHLRLNEPLALELGGAVRFVDVLQQATEVANSWHNVHRGRQSYLSPSDANKRQSKRESRLLSSQRTKRPLDGIFNFMPAGIEDKAMLKQAILVMTISRPFLASTVNTTAEVIPSRNSKRWSSILARPKSGAQSRSHSTYSTKSSVSLPPTYFQSSASTFQQAIVAHVLPRTHDTRSPLARSLENFLLAFVQPMPKEPSPLKLRVPSVSSSYMDPPVDTRPFLLHHAALGSTITAPPSLHFPSFRQRVFSVTDLLVIGALSNGRDRAYVSGAEDVTFTDGVSSPLAETQRWLDGRNQSTQSASSILLGALQPPSSPPSLTTADSSEDESHNNTILRTPSPSSTVEKEREIKEILPKIHVFGATQPGWQENKYSRPPLRQRRSSTPNPMPKLKKESSRWSFLPWKGPSVAVR